MSPQQTDILIIGAGIAGASTAYFLAPHARTVLLERESQPGYHSTGRSAALFSETYGSPPVRILSRASRPFLASPPEGFAEVPILTPRGALMVAGPGQEGLMRDELAAMQGVTPSVRGLSREEVLALVPSLRPEVVAGGILEPDACDIDVHALHQGFLRGARQKGCMLACDAPVTSIERISGAPGAVTAESADSAEPAQSAERPARWRVHTPQGVWETAVIVNAAGAWADEVARLAGVRRIGLQPRRRSAFTFTPPDSVDPRAWPMVIALDESWYIKPDAGVLLGSPANADPVEPHDVQAEEFDIALAIHNIQEATHLSIRRPIRVWAGLRSFVADGSLVGGAFEDEPGFVWNAAQGGYGIQTCAAMGEACAALALGRSLPDSLRAAGVTEAMLSPDRPGLSLA
ncbi:MAG: NAD(P)/FAD-dependent oxidoreductase [Burkholderiaceae bacterium]